MSAVCRCSRRFWMMMQFTLVCRQEKPRNAAWMHATRRSRLLVRFRGGGRFFASKMGGRSPDGGACCSGPSVDAGSGMWDVDADWRRRPRVRLRSHPRDRPSGAGAGAAATPPWSFPASSSWWWQPVCRLSALSALASPMRRLELLLRVRKESESECDMRCEIGRRRRPGPALSLVGRRRWWASMEWCRAARREASTACATMAI